MALPNLRFAAVDDSTVASRELFDASPAIVSPEFADGIAGLHTAEFTGVPATGVVVRLPYSTFYDAS